MSEFDNTRTYLKSILTSEIPTIDIPGLTNVNNVENRLDYYGNSSAYNIVRNYYGENNIIYLDKDVYSFEFNEPYINVNISSDEALCYAKNDEHGINIPCVSVSDIVITYPSIGNYTGSISFKAHFEANVNVYIDNGESESDYDVQSYTETHEWDEDIKIEFEIEINKWDGVIDYKHDGSNDISCEVILKREDGSEEDTIILTPCLYDDGNSDSEFDVDDNGFYYTKKDSLDYTSEKKYVENNGDVWNFIPHDDKEEIYKIREISVNRNIIVDGCFVRIDEKSYRISKELEHNYEIYKFDDNGDKNNIYNFTWYKVCSNNYCKHEVKIYVEYIKVSQEESDEGVIRKYDVIYDGKKIDTIDIIIPYFRINDYDTINDKLKYINLKNFFDSNNNGIDTEYDYMLENYNSSLYDVNIVPSINSFGYIDGNDGVGNQYRLNASKIFGKNNLSPSLLKASCDYQDHAYDMPYFFIDNFKNDNEFSDSKFLSCDNIKYNKNDDKKCIYLIDDKLNYFGDNHKSSMTKDNFNKFLTDLTNNNEKIFEKLFMYNDACKYSTFKYNPINNTAETLFNGVKLCVDKLYISDENETKVSAQELDDVKFTFLYVPVLLTPENMANYTLKIIYNKEYRYIVGIRTVSMFNEEYYITTYLINSSNGNEKDEQIYVNDKLFRTKMYMMDKLTCELRNQNEKNPSPTEVKLVFENVSDDILSNDSIYYDIKDEDNKLYIRYRTRTINEIFKKFLDISSISNKSDNLWRSNASVIVELINPSNGSKTTRKNIRVSDKKNDSENYYHIEFKDGFMEMPLSLSGKSINIKDYSKVIITLGESDMFETLYSGTYDEYTMNGIKKSLESKNVDYIYSSYDENYRIKLHLEEPDALYTYDVIQPVVETLTTSKGESVIGGYTLGMKSVNDMSLEAINRYSGYYEPIANDVLFFKSSKDFDSYDKVYIDYNYKSSANNFGIIRNVCFHKASSNEHLLNQDNPVYPMIGECALDYRDMNIFSSSWDDGYYIQYTKPNDAYYDYGTRGMKNNKSFMGGKYVNLPDSISFVGLNNMVEWDDKYVSNPYLVKDEGMYHEVNNSSVEFYLMIEKRLIRFLKEKLRPEFVKYVNVEYGFGNTESIDDDIEEYIKLNILKLYEIEEVKLWVRDESSSLHNGDIENDYTGYVNYDSENDYKKFGMKMTNGFQMKNLTNNNFDRKITYNMKNGKKEYFGWSFKIKKL